MLEVEKAKEGWSEKKKSRNVEKGRVELEKCRKLKIVNTE